MTFLPILKTGSVPPAIQASGIVFNSWTRSTINLSWVNGNGIGRIVAVFRGKVAYQPINGMNYNANASYGLGQALGGGFVVGNFTGATNTITFDSLEKFTDYTVGVFEYEAGFIYNRNMTLSANVGTRKTTL